MRRLAAVCIDDDLAPGQSAVALRPANDKSACRIDQNSCIRVRQFRRERRHNDQSGHILTNLLQIRLGAMLRRQHHGVHTHRLPVLVILDGHLSLAVRTKIPDQALPTHFRQTLRHLVGERNRQRHQLRRLAARIAKHQPLVSGAVVQISASRFFGFIRFVDAQRNVG